MRNETICLKGGKKETKKKLLLSMLSAALLLNVFSCGVRKEKMPELTWIVPYDEVDGFDETERRINDITAKRLGITVNIECVNADEYKKRVDAMNEVGDDIDLCYTGFYADDYRARVRDGRLMELNGLLEYTPALRRTLPDYLWDGAEINGKIYAVPNQQIEATSTGLVILKDLADKYKLDVSKVKSIDDVEPFMEQIKQNEPNVYPIRINWGPDGIQSIDSNEFQEMFYAGVYVKNVDGKIKVKIATEDEKRKNSAQKIYEWYSKGYIRKDIAIANDAATDLADGKYAMWFETYKPGVEHQRKLMTGNDVYAAQISKPYIAATSVQGAMTGINSSSKHPIEAIKLLELVNTEPDILNLITYGIENKNYKKISPNVVERSDEVFSCPTWLFGNQFIIYTDSRESADVWEQTKKINDTAVKSPIVGFEADTSMLTGEYAKCWEVLDRYTVIDSGTENPQKYWDKLDRELRAAGAEKIKQEFEKQINEFLLKKQN